MVRACLCTFVSVCVDVKRVSHPGDVHDLDGCQLSRLDMATLVKAETQSDKILGREARQRFDSRNLYRRLDEMTN